MNREMVAKELTAIARLLISKDETEVGDVTEEEPTGSTPVKTHTTRPMS